jgi:hypothetical protein
VNKQSASLALVVTLLVHLQLPAVPSARQLGRESSSGNSIKFELVTANDTYLSVAKLLAKW